MAKGTQSRLYTAVNLVLLLFLAVFIVGFFALLFVEKYPSADSLVYEACTFERYERIHHGKYGDTYLIYVEEKEKPLRIDSITACLFSGKDLDGIKAGDIIVVSMEEGDGFLDLYSLSHGDNPIFTYEDFLEAQDGNDTVGAVGVGVMALLFIGLLIANVILYKKTGVCLYPYMRGYYRPR